MDNFCKSNFFAQKFNISCIRGLKLNVKKRYRFKEATLYDREVTKKAKILFDFFNFALIQRCLFKTISFFTFNFWCFSCCRLPLL
jgi:hypothetical protein